MLDEHEIIARIYVAAAVPELWGGRGVLDVIAEVATCTDGVVIAIDDEGVMRWITNDSAAPKLEVYFRENWVVQNPYLGTVLASASLDSFLTLK